MNKYMGAPVCFEQKGTVEQITGSGIKVRVRRDALCDHCNARGICFIGEGTERELEISDFTPGIVPGDSVDVVITRSMGNKAIILGYLVPFLILVVVLILLNHFGVNELVSGLSSLASLVPYFILLYLLRNRLRKTFSLSARKNDF